MKRWLIAIARRLYVFYLDVLNYGLTYVPSNRLRIFLLRHVYRARIGRDCTIHMGVQFKRPRQIVIGDCVMVNARAILDGRHTLTIGDNVDIGEQAALFCGGHDPQSPDYSSITAPIVVEDYVCVNARAMVIVGVTLGKGCVVGAGAVVNKDVPPYTIVAGVPAKKIGERTRDLRYSLGRSATRKTWTP